MTKDTQPKRLDDATIPRDPAVFEVDASALIHYRNAGTQLNVAVVVLKTAGQAYVASSQPRTVASGRVLISIEGSLEYEASHQGFRDYHELVNDLSRETSKE